MTPAKETNLYIFLVLFLAIGLALFFDVCALKPASVVNSLTVLLPGFPV